ncbi:MAG: 2,3-bisphosphoglycerate-independent phosphoglycerate mutase [Candidatus Acetothermia bacterium]
MKTILVIADGLAGRPDDTEAGTCLQVAKTPTIDGLVSRGTAGLMHPIKPGVRPGSDTAHLSLFGYNPYQYYTGRGVFEAAGIGMELSENDVSFRTNFATIDPDGKITDRRAGRISEGQEELEEALSGLTSEKYPDVEIRFKTSTEHRGALSISGDGLGGNVTPTDPHELGVPIPQSQGLDERSSKTADVLNEVTSQARDLLESAPINVQRREEGKLPANAILSRGAAKYPDMPPVEEVYGITASVVAAGALYIGVARVAGMEYIPVEGATGTVDSKIINKAKAALKELDRGKDLVFIHMKGTDNASHDHNAEAKVKFIEKIDETFAWLDDNIDWSETHLCFTGDHTTPINYGDHVAEPVPAMAIGPNVKPDNVEKFDEYTAMNGGLGTFNGQILPITLSYSDQLKKFGA